MGHHIDEQGPMTDHRICCGDTVWHQPTGEDWKVAYADYETGFIAWSGWPEGRAQIEDCDLVRAATDEEHRAHVAEWLDKPHGNDHRARAIRRLYRPLPPEWDPIHLGC